MKQIILVILILFVVMITACQDLYTPQIEEFPDALVVEGILTDQNNYVTVKLTRSASFNEESYYYGERKATVTIENTVGTSFSTTEINRGVYQTNEPVQTTVGVGYYVKIITSGNEVYCSDVETMMPPASIDSIYFNDSTFRDLSYNYWGEPIVKDFKGISFAVKPTEPEGGEYGYLYKWNIITNYMVVSTAGMTSSSYFCWEELFSNNLYVYDYYHDEFIIDLPVGDIHALSYYTLSPLPIDSSRFEGFINVITTSSFYYHLKQYTISRNGAKYWRSVRNQSEVSGKLFDPVEEQIFGNIHCISDPSKIAFGFFNVASYTDMVVAVKLQAEKVKGSRIVNVMPIISSPEDCYQPNQVTEFWF